MPAKSLRAVGVVRVSRVGGRGERFVSPEEQQERIEALCAREGFRLIATPFPELDVSGGTPLAGRPGLKRAVEAIERGEADVLIAAYFDRLVRSVKVQQEVVDRVEAAGGRIALADFGDLTNGTAVQWLSGTLIGAVSEYVRRSIGERSAAGQQVALEAGRWPTWLAPGLRRAENGTVELDHDRQPVVQEAFELRASGKPIAAVRDFLAINGIERSYHGVSHLMGNRQMIGELRFGQNIGKCPVVVDLGTFERVQRTIVSRGRLAKSDRLLARLGVLRCDTCDSRMTVGIQRQKGREYPHYRCGQRNGQHVIDCDGRATIMAHTVEDAVIKKVKEVLAGYKETETQASGVGEAAGELERAQSALDGAIKAFVGLETEPAAIERLQEMRTARDRARAHYDELAASRDATTLAVSVGDWDELTWDEKRDLVKATIAEVKITRGRGKGRITILDKKGQVTMA